MQVYANKLQQHLATQLRPLYLVFGDDDFLRLQALSEIRQAAKQKGFSEREVFQQNAEFRWFELQQSSQNLSLFANQRILELEMPNAAPGQEGAKALQAFIEQQADDTLLILHGPKLKAEQQRSKWFKMLDKHGVFVPVYTPDKTQLHQFIQQRAHYYQLSLDAEAMQLLVNWYEGNLLALDQALAKLALLHLNKQVNANDVHNSADEQSRYDVFALQDALLKGQADAFFHRLQRLFETDGEPAIIHWLLQRECQTLHNAFVNIQGGNSVGEALQSAGVWKSQQQAYQRLLADWNPALSTTIQRLLVRAELALKRDSKEDLATLFSHIGLLLLNPRQAESLSLMEHASENFS